jgi:hypothetical protein
MGVLLLLGTMLLFAASVPWLLPPSNAICAVRSVVFVFSTKNCLFLSTFLFAPESGTERLIILDPDQDLTGFFIAKIFP